VTREELARSLEVLGLSGVRLEVALRKADDYAAHMIELHARTVPWPWPPKRARKPAARKDEAS
jgi:hypothetical protein